MSSDKAWSCQELVDHADNWSLAGNVGLFKHMEQFAEDLFKIADETNKNLENLLEDMDRTEIQLDLVKNQFLSLQNTQFIESRVYEDDETVSEAITEKPEVKLDECRKKELLKSAVVDGLKVLDKYFEKVSIPESDSEGDEPDCSNYVLRERDPYIGRPLPYVIGTEEWHTKWHAGLEESSDEDGDDADMKANGNGRVEDEFSDTGSESNLPVADRRSTTQVKDDDDDDVHEDVGGNSMSAKTPITHATFAEQLAEKLGDVLSTPRTTTDDPEVNTRPIQRKQPAAGNSLILNSPPQIVDDQLGTSSGGLFSGGGGLFDDEDDDCAAKPPPITANRRKAPNLFDEDEEDDGGTNDQTHEEDKRRIGGLFDESDDEGGALESGRKHLGGVNVLGGFLSRKRVSSSSDEGDDNKAGEVTGRKVATPPLLGRDEKETKRVLSLFDDTDDLFEDDLFSPKRSSLFDDDDACGDSLPPPLFAPCAAAAAAEASERKTKTRNLFDESSSSSSSSEEEDMFAAPIVASGESVFDARDEVVKGDWFKDELTANVAKTIAPNIDERHQPATKARFSLFDDKPPSLLSDDDEWQTQGKLINNTTSDKDLEEVTVVNRVEGIVDGKARQCEEDDDRSAKAIEKSPEKKLPGRLTHNLNINVNALMPGARMPKAHADATDIEEEAGAEVAIGQTEVQTGAKNVAESASAAVTPPMLVGIVTEDVNILHSVTKTRARIQVKRRPSTRRGRKAALRSAQMSDGDVVVVSGSEPPGEDRSMSTDVQEASSQSDQPPALEQAHRQRAKDVCDDLRATKKARALFDDDLEGADIFGSPAVVGSARSPAKASSTPRRQLVVEDVEDGDDARPPPLFAEGENGRAEAAAVAKISLFDDLDDCHDSDDLFAAKKGVANVRVYDNVMPRRNEATKDAAKGALSGEANDDAGDAVLEQRASKIVQTKSLFGDDDDDDEDDDLFGDVPARAKARTKDAKRSASAMPERKPDNKNRSLFGDDDDDDDDDIFNTKSAKSMSVSKPAGKSSAAALRVSKNAAKSDPLADLFGDSD